MARAEGAFRMSSSAASLVVDAEGLPWRPTPFPGVAWKKLRFDSATGASAVLLRFEPGARYGSHRHPGGAVGNTATYQGAPSFIRNHVQAPPTSEAKTANRMITKL